MPRKNYIRLQYQKDKYYISEKHESNDPIGLTDLIRVLVSLPKKVEKQYGNDVAGKVAVVCVDLIIKFSKNSKWHMIGDGASMSQYLNIKSKNKTERTERVDIEIYGEAGKDLNDNEVISRLNKFINDKL